MYDTIGQACGPLLVLALVMLIIMIACSKIKSVRDKLDYKPEEEEKEDGYDTYHG